MAARCEAMGQAKYVGITRRSGKAFKWTGALTVDRGALLKPYRSNKGRRVFVNSMSDLFHEDLPLAVLRDIWRVMVGTPQHSYQVLTKRADRLLELSPTLM